MKNLNLNDKTKGIICILFAALGFSLMTFFVRISGDIPTMEKAFFRNAVAIIVSLFFLLRSGERIRIKEHCAGDIFFRCLFGTSGLIANFYAIALLALAGDLGGAVGPAIIGNVSQKAANNLRAGVLAGIGFPIVLVISVLYIRRKYR